MANLSRNLRWQSVYGSKFISGIVVKKKKNLCFSQETSFLETMGLEAAGTCGNEAALRAYL